MAVPLLGISLTRITALARLLCGALMLAPASSYAYGTVTANSPAIGVHNAQCSFAPVAISGRGFGWPFAPDSYVRIYGFSYFTGLVDVQIDAATACDLIEPPPFSECSQPGVVDPSTSCATTQLNCIIDWTDERVVVSISPHLYVAEISVVTATGGDAEYIDFYQLDLFDTCALSPGQGVEVSSTRDVWINGEFRGTLPFWDHADQTVKTIPSYPPPVGTPYWGLFNGPTAIVSYGEDVIIGGGRVWITESGTEPPFGGIQVDSPNHGRILAFDEATGTMASVYNIPGNRNGILGVAWDEARGRVWFSQTGNLTSGEPARLTSFDPNEIADDDFDYVFAPGPGEVCQNPGQPTSRCLNGSASRRCASNRDCMRAAEICTSPAQSGCYRDYALIGDPPVYQAAHIAVHPDGSIWFTNYSSILGSSIARLEPEANGGAGRLTQYPVSHQPTALPAAPWEIKIAPNSNDVLFAGWQSSKIGRLNYALVEQPQCQTMVSGSGASCEPFELIKRDPSCRNPCIQEFQIPGAWLTEMLGCGGPLQHTRNFQVFSIEPAPSGDLWFDRGYIHGGAISASNLVTANVIAFPPIGRLFPNVNPCVKICGRSAVAEYEMSHGIGADVAIDPVDGSIWAGDYNQKRIIRLRPQ